MQHPPETKIYGLHWLSLYIGPCYVLVTRDVLHLLSQSRRLSADTYKAPGPSSSMKWTYMSHHHIPEEISTGALSEWSPVIWNTWPMRD